MQFVSLAGLLAFTSLNNTRPKFLCLVYKVSGAFDRKSPPQCAQSLIYTASMTTNISCASAVFCEGFDEAKLFISADKCCCFYQTYTPRNAKGFLRYVFIICSYHVVIVPLPCVSVQGLERKLIGSCTFTVWRKSLLSGIKQMKLRKNPTRFLLCCASSNFPVSHS